MPNKLNISEKLDTKDSISVYQHVPSAVENESETITYDDDFDDYDSDYGSDDFDGDTFLNDNPLDQPLPNNKTLIYQAIKIGDHKLLQELLQAGADPNRDTDKHPLPIVIALRKGRTAMAEKLMEAGATLDDKTIEYIKTTYSSKILRKAEQLKERYKAIHRNDSLYSQGRTYQSSALHVAAEQGCLNIVKFLLKKGEEINSLDPVGNVSALHLAVKNGKEELVKYLLSHGAELSQQDTNGDTPLHMAVKRGNWTITKLLLSHSAKELYSRNHLGETPLHTAVIIKNVNVAKLLISHKVAKLSNQVADNKILLNVAIENEDLEMIKLLLTHKVKLAIADTASLLELVVKRNRIDILEILLHRRDIKLSKQDFNIILSFAAEYNRLDMAKMALSRGAKLSSQDNLGNTPLHMAARSGHKEMAQWLIKRGAKLSSQDNLGNTPLHMAARNGHKEMTQWLIKRGANLFSFNQDNLAPLHVAIQAGNYPLSELLEQAESQHKSRFSYQWDKVIKGNTQPKLLLHVTKGTHDTVLTLAARSGNQSLHDRLQDKINKKYGNKYLDTLVDMQKSKEAHITTTVLEENSVRSTSSPFSSFGSNSCHRPGFFKSLSIPVSEPICANVSENPEAIVDVTIALK
ncbi:ankyrin repeat domain protein [Candidatus Rickettsiella viridis]|uniref:Ankyrin repeat domain protein n=1 Tax=Candidatus Rickettsiella viridis TaxID=676208 RepID=A0A2Z5UXM8_9COXI|nr:ankyrin repeat domain-containing protein [Candidatus Rickettsiella viridis]BBB15883.1 ankyrin repeat domain protein [Candidatus Rickettsiella viridis]